MLSTLLAVSALYLTGLPGVHAALKLEDYVGNGCPPGRVLAVKGNEYVCTSCPTGFIGPGGKAKCQPCGEDTKPNSAGAACVACPPNTFSLNPPGICTVRCGEGYSNRESNSNRDSVNCYYRGCEDGLAVRESLRPTTNGLECRACDRGAYVYVSGTPAMPSCVSCTALGAELNR